MKPSIESIKACDFQMATLFLSHFDALDPEYARCGIECPEIATLWVEVETTDHVDDFDPSPFTDKWVDIDKEPDSEDRAIRLLGALTKDYDKAPALTTLHLDDVDICFIKDRRLIRKINKTGVNYTLEEFPWN